MDGFASVIAVATLVWAVHAALRGRLSSLATAAVIAYLALPGWGLEVGATILVGDLLGVMLLAFAIRRRSARGVASRSARGVAWFAVALATYLVGVTVVYWRYAAFIVPLLYASRFVVAAGTAWWSATLVDAAILLRAVSIAGIAMFCFALGQTVAPESLGLALEAFSAGDGAEPVAGTYRGRLLLTSETLRAFGTYGSSTLFGGVAAAVAAVLASHPLGRQRHVLGVACAMSAAALSYSRHALLAVAVVVAGLLVQRAANRLRLAVAGLFLVISVTGIFSTDFLEARVSRGLLGDENIHARVVDGPQRFARRLVDEPSIGLLGIGVGPDLILTGSRLSAAREGFVSNGALLHVFYLGVPGGIFYLYTRGAASRLAWRSARRGNTAIVGCIAALLIIDVADNYAFLHQSIHFAWALFFGINSPSRDGTTHMQERAPV